MIPEFGICQVEGCEKKAVVVTMNLYNEKILSRYCENHDNPINIKNSVHNQMIFVEDGVKLE